MVLGSMKTDATIRRVENDFCTAKHHITCGGESNTTSRCITSYTSDCEYVARWQFMQQVVYNVVDAIDVEPRLFCR